MTIPNVFGVIVTWK